MAQINDSKRTPLQSNDGWTDYEVVDENCIQLQSMGCDIQVTREEIAELAKLFPVPSGDKAGTE